MTIFFTKTGRTRVHWKYIYAVVMSELSFCSHFRPRHVSTHSAHLASKSGWHDNQHVRLTETQSLQTSLNQFQEYCAISYHAYRSHVITQGMVVQWSWSSICCRRTSTSASSILRSQFIANLAVVRWFPKMNWRLVQNPFALMGHLYPYNKDKSICHLRGVWCISFLTEIHVSNAHSMQIF